MNWVAMVVVVFKVILLILQMWNEKSAIRKERLKQAWSKIEEGISERDPNKINAGFDMAHNI